jgi:hypothetical protein
MKLRTWEEAHTLFRFLSGALGPILLPSRFPSGFSATARSAEQRLLVKLHAR